MTFPHPAPAWYVVLVTTAAQMVVAMSNIVLSTIAPKVAESLGVAPVWVGYHVGLTFGAAGYYSTDTLLLLPLMGAGTWVGERLGNRISQENFSNRMALLLLIAGAGLLAK